jgi:transposase-like protein
VPAPSAAHPRVPVEVDGVQVNHCRNPHCTNFGIPAQTTPVRKGRPPRGANSRPDLYRLNGLGKYVPGLKCGDCSETVPIKSNAGIAEEITRLSAPLLRFERSRVLPGCPNPLCSNHGRSASEHPELYRKYGATKAGSRRWRCKAKGCGASFTQPLISTLRHRRILDNEVILRLLMNKVPLRRICEVAGIGAPALYGKIEFLHRQAQLLAIKNQAS